MDKILHTDDETGLLAEYEHYSNTQAPRTYGMPGILLAFSLVTSPAFGDDMDSLSVNSQIETSSIIYVDTAFSVTSEIEPIIQLKKLGFVRAKIRSVSPLNLVT